MNKQIKGHHKRYDTQTNGNLSQLMMERFMNKSGIIKIGKVSLRNCLLLSQEENQKSIYTQAKKDSSERSKEKEYNVDVNKTNLNNLLSSKVNGFTYTQVDALIYDHKVEKEESKKAILSMLKGKKFKLNLPRIKKRNIKKMK